MFFTASIYLCTTRQSCTYGDASKSRCVRGYVLRLDRQAITEHGLEVVDAAREHAGRLGLPCVIDRAVCAVQKLCAVLEATQGAVDGLVEEVVHRGRWRTHVWECGGLVI
jgi:hypothetical protein